MSDKDQELNARNLLCPMPVIRLQNFMGKMQSGEVVKIICTDPGTKNDIPTWSRINKHEVVEMQEGDYELWFRVRKG